LALVRRASAGRIAASTAKLPGQRTTRFKNFASCDFLPQRTFATLKQRSECPDARTGWL